MMHSRKLLALYAVKIVVAISFYWLARQQGTDLVTGVAFAMLWLIVAFLSDIASDLHALLHQQK